MKKLFILIVCVCALMFTTASALELKDGSEFTYMTEDYPPFNFEKDGKVVGFTPELLRLMWKKMNIQEQPIKLLPWARGYKLTQLKKNHVLMSMTRTKDRESLFKWVGPIANTQYVLIKSSKNNLHISSLDDARKFKIGTVREDATDQILKALNFKEKNIVKLTKIDQAIKMLYANRIDMIAYDKKSFFDILKQKNHSSFDFKSVFLLSEVKDYYAFNKETPDAEIQKFQNALDSLKKEHKKLLNYYFN